MDLIRNQRNSDAIGQGYRENVAFCTLIFKRDGHRCSPLRLLILTDTAILGPGGSERFLRNLLTRFAEPGILDRRVATCR